MDKYGKHEGYEDLSVDSFPVVPANQDIVDSLQRFAARFTEDAHVLTIIEGATGAGKTALAWALLDEKISADNRVAGTSGDEFVQIFCQYLMHDNDGHLPLLKFCQETPFDR